MKENGKAKYQTLREKFGNKCAVCGGKNKSPHKKAILEFHHLSYPNGRLNHHPHQLWRDIETNPSNFRLLCKYCHITVTVMARASEAVKIMEIVRLSEPPRAEFT